MEGKGGRAVSRTEQVSLWSVVPALGFCERRVKGMLAASRVLKVLAGTGNTEGRWGVGVSGAPQWCGLEEVLSFLVALQCLTAVVTVAFWRPLQWGVEDDCVLRFTTVIYFCHESCKTCPCTSRCNEPFPPGARPPLWWAWKNDN